MMKSTRKAYLLWLLTIVGLNGIHRFYLGKKVSGVIWLLTFGIVGIGQLIDAVLMPKMVTECNGVPGRVHEAIEPPKFGFVPASSAAVVDPSSAQPLVKQSSDAEQGDAAVEAA